MDIKKSPPAAFAWLGILVLGGCSTSPPLERVPGYGILPDAYTVYFSLDMNTLGAPVSEILQEEEELKALRSLVEKGDRLWGALTSPEPPGRTVIILEGNYSSLLIGMGLTFDFRWNRSGRGYWENKGGQQLAIIGGERLLYSHGEMETLLSLARPDGTEAAPPLPREEGKILEMGDLVVYGRDGDFLRDLLPLSGMANLVSWSVILTKGEDYHLLFSLTLEEENSARFLGTTLKLLLLGQEPGEEAGGMMLTDGRELLGRLASGKITRRGREVLISGICLSEGEFKALLGHYMGRRREDG